MKTTQVKICGFGGQGIVLAGYILGKAATIYDKKHATMTQSYGPESRGGACSAQLIISDTEIDFPEVLVPDIMVIMSKEAYEKYVADLRAGGILIYDTDLVENNNALPASTKVHSIPATRLAEELGKKIVSNIIMLGYFTAITKIVGAKSMEEAIRTSIPKGTEELNLRAFQKGYEHVILGMEEKRK